MLDRGKEQAGRRQHARMRRHGNPSDAQFARQRRRVQRPAAAQRQERVTAGIDAAADRDEPDRFRHLGVENPMDARAPHARGSMPSGRAIVVLDRPARKVGESLSEPAAK